MPNPIKELITTDGDGDASSDSDQEVSSIVQKDKTERNKNTEEQELERIIQKINDKLDRGEPIDLSSYQKKLFVVNYRGIHFFKQNFEHDKQKSDLDRIKENRFNDSIYSAAVYDRAGLKMGEIIDTLDKKEKIKSAKGEVKQNFNSLGKKTGKRWWSQSPEESPLSCVHYQRYANSFSLFMNENKEKKQECYKEFESKLNPYISTSDDPKHAVSYAFGAKTAVNNSHGPLRPGYLESGQAKHPKVGYVQVIFHEISDLNRHQPLFLSSLHASKSVNIKYRTLNERETTYLGSISAKHIVSTKIIRFPSFNQDFKEGYHNSKYGLEKKSFDSYKRNITNSASRKKEINQTTLVDHLTNHYSKQLKDETDKIAAKRGGYIVYLGLDGRLRKTMPTTLDIRTERKNSTADKNADGTSLMSNNLSFFEKNKDTDSEEEFLNIPGVQGKGQDQVVSLMSNLQIDTKPTEVFKELCQR